MSHPSLARTILTLNRSGIPATIPSILAAHPPTTDKDSLLNTLDLLIDWGLVDGEYQGLRGGRGGYCYTISDIGIQMLNAATPTVAS